MGFGFNLFVVFILMPATLILLVTWLVIKKRILIKILGAVWAGVVAIVILSTSVQLITSKKQLKKHDFYGSYIINRNYFKGKQADWQYNTFRFEIKSNDSIYFYVTDSARVLKTYKGKIATLKPYSSERLVITMEQPTHHILSGNPTIYRSAWSFYLVFNSPRFNNVFFTKGEWQPLN